MKRKQSGLRIMSRLIVLVKPLSGFMCLAVLLGVLGFLCAIQITVAGSLTLLRKNKRRNRNKDRLYLHHNFCRSQGISALRRAGVQPLYSIQAFGSYPRQGVQSHAPAFSREARG